MIRLGVLTMPIRVLSMGIHSLSMGIHCLRRVMNWIGYVGTEKVPPKRDIWGNPLGDEDP